MATTVNVGWLNDENGDKFAPKTLSSQVINNDGTSLQNTLNTMTSNIENKAQVQFITWEAND